MKYKVDQVAARLTGIVSAWPGVESIVVDPRVEALSYDPYFALALDVYHRDPIPPASDRRKAYGDPGAFESFAGREKDRFFLEEIPVRIEFKQVSDIDHFLDHPMDHLRNLKDSGTYPLYRLLSYRVLSDATGWIGSARTRLDRLPEGFWVALRRSFQSKMEHSLADIGAAILSGDSFFMLVSCAGFVRYTAASIFMANRRFEPSHREIDTSIHSLTRLPDDFLGPWETFLREDQGVSPTQKRELAELMVRSVLALG